MSAPQPNQPTNLPYLNDTYLFESGAKILNIFQHELSEYPQPRKPRGEDNPQLASINKEVCLILDQTIFYPQGGGQPSDVGFILSSNGNFEVTKTIFNPDGQVWHLGYFVSGNFEIGQDVVLKIDQQKRLLNARNHTAGHLIDLAIESLELSLVAVKGFHFPIGAYVEYSGELENLDIAEKLEQKVNEIIQQNPKINFELQESKHESGKPMRIMNVEGFKSCPCGGTHVKSALEVGKISIKKIKNNKGNIRISYQIEG